MSSRKIQTVDDVKKTLSMVKKENARNALARAMLKHGNLTDEALLWVGDNYASVWEET